MNLSINLNSIETQKQPLSIFLIWLFHLTGILGISMGFGEWFIPKTPITLLLAFILLIWNFPINSTKKWAFMGLFFLVGMMAEWIGVKYGWLFGSYYYGENLGPKFGGVPWLIGINWALLVLITGCIASRLFQSKIIRVIVGALLMLLLDFFLETSAPIFDFWVWEAEGIPIQNFIAWFFISAFLHAIYQQFFEEGNFRFSLHLYNAQLVFFGFFYGFNSF